MNKYKNLLFYKYTKIEQPERVKFEQMGICNSLELKGRIIVAKEGLNATLEGRRHNINKYIEYMKTLKGFENIDFKVSESTGSAYPRLSVKVRDEIVSAHLDEDFDPNETSGKYIYSEELHEWFRNGKEFYLVDMRNDYEQVSGHFEGSINSNFENFRDLPKIKEKIGHLVDKTIVTVCTGGVRCEKASGYLVKCGFKDVYQLYGGIQTYMAKYPGEDWLGKLYVFDKRTLIDFTKGTDKKHPVIGKCTICKNSTEHYIDCLRPECHAHQLVCEDCIEKFGGKPFCSHKCMEISNRNND
jgi:UPF0176 protein